MVFIPINVGTSVFVRPLVWGFESIWSIVELGFVFCYCQLISVSHRLQIFPVAPTTMCLAWDLEYWRVFSVFLLHSQLSASLAHLCHRESLLVGLFISQQQIAVALYLSQGFGWQGGSIWFSCCSLSIIQALYTRVPERELIINVPALSPYPHSLVSV